MKGCIGGTFDILHQGHERLFESAFEHFETLVVGITSDDFASHGRGRVVRPYETRTNKVEKYLEKNAPIPWSIERLDDAYGPAIDEDLEGIVVSAETVSGDVDITATRG